MKKLILIACLIVAWALIYYPVFDSTGISYLIIFSCLVIVCFAGAKLYTSDVKEDYESVEKGMDKLNELDGIFQYVNDGFYLNRQKSVEFVKWDDIISINSFNVRAIYKSKVTGLEIITRVKSYEFNNQDTPEIEKLVNKFHDNLQMLEGDLMRECIDNYGIERVNLYRKNNITS